MQAIQIQTDRVRTDAGIQGASVRARAKGDEGVHKVADIIARFKAEVATRALPVRKA